MSSISSKVPLEGDATQQKEHLPVGKDSDDTIVVPLYKQEVEIEY